MRFYIKDRNIEEAYGTRIGIQGDNHVETIEFVLPKIHNGIDLSEGIAFILYSTVNGTSGYIPNIQKDCDDENLILTWLVGNQVTQEPGTLNIEIKISGLNDSLWHSEITTFIVSKSIQVNSPQNPVVFRMSGEIGMSRMANPETEPEIIVAERQMVIPTELQNIAVQNDQNSETIKIRMPRYYDGHDLNRYSIWLKTIINGSMDDRVALTAQAYGNELIMEWTLRPPQTSYSGKLGIQLWVTGENFDWQTADATVNIMRSLTGTPVKPLEPSFIEDFLKKVSLIEQQAKAFRDDANTAARNAAASAKEAAGYVDSIYFNLKAPPVSIINEAVILDCGTPAIIKGMG